MRWQIEKGTFLIDHVRLLMVEEEKHRLAAGKNSSIHSWFQNNKRQRSENLEIWVGMTQTHMFQSETYTVAICTIARSNR